MTTYGLWRSLRASRPSAPAGTVRPRPTCPNHHSPYVVKRPVRLAGKRLRVLEQFALDVSAEEMAETGTFVRRLVTGPFSTTDKIDYCDPEAGGHDDD